MTWDPYPSDPLGYTTGLAAELNVPRWAARYGFFQEQRVSGGAALDSRFLKAWGMVTEVERRYTVRGHPGSVRVLGHLNQAHLGSYQAALERMRGGQIGPLCIVAAEPSQRSDDSWADGSQSSGRPFVELSS